MTSGVPPHLLPIRDRQALLQRQRDLVDAAAAVDADQQRLAVEFGRLRRELSETRELLWPSEHGHAFLESRRPGLAGPAPVPPPIADAIPLWGRGLRDAALRVLLHADRPLALREIHRALHLAGHVLSANDPVKQLGDALGYEERRGVVRRVRRATYTIGTLTPYRRRVLETSTASKRCQP